MTVTPPIYDCSLARSRPIQGSFSFCLPRPGAARDEVVFAALADFFDEASPGCTQQYSIQVLDGSSTLALAAPSDHYEIRPDGRLIFKNTGDRAVADYLRIEVTSFGGPEPVVQYSETFTVETECCADSTVVFAPNMARIEGAVNDLATADDIFSSSNALCPIEKHEFCSGSGSGSHFDLVDRESSGFSVSLNTASA